MKTLTHSWLLSAFIFHGLATLGCAGADSSTEAVASISQGMTAAELEARAEAIFADLQGSKQKIREHQYLDGQVLPRGLLERFQTAVSRMTDPNEPEVLEAARELEEPLRQLIEASKIRLGTMRAAQAHIRAIVEEIPEPCAAAFGDPRRLRALSVRALREIQETEENEMRELYFALVEIESESIRSSIIAVREVMQGPTHATRLPRTPSE